MRKEDLFIIELCRFLSPDTEKLLELSKEGLDYSYILGKILINRIGGIAYHTLSQINLLQNTEREFKNCLTTMYKNNVEKTNELLTILDSISVAFKNESFKYAILKGGYLASVFPIGTRTSNDVDVLVDTCGIDQLTKCLKENEYIQGFYKNGVIQPATRAEIISSRLNRGELVPFIKRMDYKHFEIAEIDVNFSLDYKANTNDGIVTKMLERIEMKIDTPSGKLQTLCKEDFIIHLCCHLYKEATTYSWVLFNRDQGLYKYIDIYALLNNETEHFVDQLLQRIHQLHKETECYYAFNVLDEMYGGIYSSVKKEIKKEDGIYNVNTIYDPIGNKTYKHNMHILDWLLCNIRKRHLYEIKNDRS